MARELPLLSWTGGVSPASTSACQRDAGSQRQTFPLRLALAERYEALSPAFDNPAPYAKRLARRLNAQPALTDSILRTSEEFEHRIDPDTRAELTTRCEGARLSLNSS